MSGLPPLLGQADPDAEALGKQLAGQHARV
jgi:hypothetical protein